MTERLYYQDPYLREFDAEVVELKKHGDALAAVLDRSAFYPTSGGQPFDRGTLGGASVIDVIDTDDGHVLHVLDREIAAGPVKGAVDWGRRFDHMQQHTGQHILSAAFDRACGARTESFHLGAASATIDINRELSAADVARAEDAANRVVWEDRPVAIRFADAAEAATLGLRKESARTGTLRLIDITGFDLSACGGTHVSSTGAVGIIAIAATERFKGGLRVTFVCGGRALEAFRDLRETVAASVRALSVLPAELPQAIERLQGEAKDQRKIVKDLQQKLSGHQAEALSGSGQDVAGLRLVAAAVPGWDAAGLKAIAAEVTARPGYLAVLVNDAVPAAIVIARGAGVVLDSNTLLRQIVERHGGKGGGRPELAQGGGLTGDPAAILRFARELIAGTVS